jgi:hypothetical protein
MKSPPPAVSLCPPPAALLLCAAVLGYLPRLPPETLPPACRAAVSLPPAVSIRLPRCLQSLRLSCGFMLLGFALHYARCLPPLQWLASPQNHFTSTCLQNLQKSLQGAKKQE